MANTSSFSRFSILILFLFALTLIAACSKPVADQTSSANPSVHPSSNAPPSNATGTEQTNSTNSNTQAVTTDTTQANTDDPLAAGKAVFSKVGCVRCHKITGVELASASGPGGGPPGGFGGGGGPPGGFGGFKGGPGGGRAPDLAKVAADPAHTSDWLAAYIRNPKSQKPDAKMPPFGENKLSEQDLTVLVEFLSNLKG